MRAAAGPTLPDPGAAAAALGERLGGGSAPEAVIVLGSGLGGVVDALADPVHVPFAELPGFPRTGVVGHAGRFVAGRLEGRRVLVQAGRFHLYEGHPPAVVALPVRVAARLRVPVLILTNAAGGIHRHRSPGSLMLLDDHLDLTGRSALAGPVQDGEARFPDMSAPYDPALQRLAEEVALARGIALRRGTYAALVGPSFETPAEIRMLARMGADAVGMSTVPEVTTARALGMRCLAVSLVTNPAAGLSPSALSHAEVLETGREAGGRLAELLGGVVAALPPEDSPPGDGASS